MDVWKTSFLLGNPIFRCYVDIVDVCCCWCILLVGFLQLFGWNFAGFKGVKVFRWNGKVNCHNWQPNQNPDVCQKLPSEKNPVKIQDLREIWIVRCLNLYPCWCEWEFIHWSSGAASLLQTTLRPFQRTLKRFSGWGKRGAGPSHLWGAYVHVYMFMSSGGFGVQVNKMFMCASWDLWRRWVLQDGWFHGVWPFLHFLAKSKISVLPKRAKAQWHSLPVDASMLDLQGKPPRCFRIFWMMLRKD